MKMKDLHSVWNRIGAYREQQQLVEARSNVKARREQEQKAYQSVRDQRLSQYVSRDVYRVGVLSIVHRAAAWLRLIKSLSIEDRSWRGVACSTLCSYYSCYSVLDPILQRYSRAQAVIRRGRFCPLRSFLSIARLRGSNRQATVGRSFGDRVAVRYIILSGGISAARFDGHGLDADKLKRRATGGKNGNGSIVISRSRDRATACRSCGSNGRCK